MTARWRCAGRFSWLLRVFRLLVDELADDRDVRFWMSFVLSFEIGVANALRKAFNVRGLDFGGLLQAQCA